MAAEETTAHLVLRLRIPGDPKALKRHRMEPLMKQEPCKTCGGEGCTICRKRGRRSVPVIHEKSGRPIIRAYDPRENQTWKATAQDHMRQALIRAARDPQQILFPDGPVRLDAVFAVSMPRSRHLKTRERPCEWRHQKPDEDNLTKLLKDAGTGILWTDDAQVCAGERFKIMARQGHQPATLVVLSRPGDPELELERWRAERWDPAATNGETP